MSFSNYFLNLRPPMILLSFNKMNDEFVLKENPYLIVGDSIRTENIYNVKAGKDQPWRVLRTGVMLLNRSYVLQINESMVDTGDLVWAIVAIQAGLFSLLLAGLVLIKRKLSRTIWDPFHTILDKLKKYQIDKDTSIEIPRSSTSEFRELSVVVSQLIRENHEAFQSQKEFTENASHELQTPLAICRTKLELLAQTEELTEEQADLVESLFDAMERISGLIKNLLLLSKLDNREFFEREHVQIETIVKKCVESFSRPAAEKNLTIKTSVDPGASVEINPGLLDVLISNLISNAVRHTPEGCVIAVDATKDSIEVSNDGLPFEYPEKIFDRFRRESRASVGNGLGLSIVKKVCDVTDNDVKYSYSSLRHHFKILFNNTQAN